MFAQLSGTPNDDFSENTVTLLTGSYFAPQSEVLHNTYSCPFVHKYRSTSLSLYSPSFLPQLELATSRYSLTLEQCFHKCAISTQVTIVGHCVHIRMTFQVRFVLDTVDETNEARLPSWVAWRIIKCSGATDFLGRSPQFAYQRMRTRNFDFTHSSESY